MSSNPAPPASGPAELELRSAGTGPSPHISLVGEVSTSSAHPRWHGLGSRETKSQYRILLGQVALRYVCTKFMHRRDHRVMSIRVAEPQRILESWGTNKTICRKCLLLRGVVVSRSRTASGISRKHHLNAVRTPESSTEVALQW